jgi:hypothetical protein
MAKAVAGEAPGLSESRGWKDHPSDEAVAAGNRRDDWPGNRPDEM